MKVIVISDTHIPTCANALPSIVEEEIKKSDYCLHAGDFVSYKFFESLRKFTKISAVCGNMDEAIVMGNLPKKQIVELENVKIGLIHGRGAPNNLIQYIKDEFKNEYNSIDIFVFGHSHLPTDEMIEGKIFFNPGSPTDKIFAPYCSYGILEIKDKTIHKKIVKI
ncbi:MAG: metallophosphatase family protein [Candidatus Omnitrophica bacterium]|nr:metallophosphatase family protein [Candidatus Omnitrophota bacterium]